MTQLHALLKLQVTDSLNVAAHQTRIAAAAQLLLDSLIAAERSSAAHQASSPPLPTEIHPVGDDAEESRSAPQLVHAADTPLLFTQKQICAMTQKSGLYRGVLLKVAKLNGVSVADVTAVVRNDRHDEALARTIHSALKRAEATDVKSARFQLGPDFFTQLRVGQRYSGIFTTVASQLGLSPSSVRQTASDMSTSKRVLSALLKEKRRLDSIPFRREQFVAPLTTSELAHFQKPNKYWGVFTTVAAQIGKSSGLVRNVAIGNATSRGVRKAVRDEMAKRDAYLADSKVAS